MTPREAVQLEPERTFISIMGWSKTAFYWIVTILIGLAWFNFGDDGTGSQYNGEVYAPMNISKR